MKTVINLFSIYFQFIVAFYVKYLTIYYKNMPRLAKLPKIKVPKIKGGLIPSKISDLGIAGIVIGVIILLAAIGVTVYFLVFKNKSDAEKKEKEQREKGLKELEKAFDNKNLEKLLKNLNEKDKKIILRLIKEGKLTKSNPVFLAYLKKRNAGNEHFGDHHGDFTRDETAALNKLSDDQMSETEKQVEERNSKCKEIVLSTCGDDANNKSILYLIENCFPQNMVNGYKTIKLKT